MATDYDAPRKNDDDVAEDSIEELKSRRNDSGSANVDEDENNAAGYSGHFPCCVPIEEFTSFPSRMTNLPARCASWSITFLSLPTSRTMGSPSALSVLAEREIIQLCSDVHARKTLFQKR